MSGSGASGAPSQSTGGGGGGAGGTDTNAGAAPTGGAGSGGEATGSDAGTDAGTTQTDAASMSARCVADEPTDVGPPEVEGSGLGGPIAELDPEQMQAFCDWLWALPGYGEEYCCRGVVRPLRIAVLAAEVRESCVDDLERLAKCGQLDVEAYESCAIDKLGRYCSTPAGCFAFGHGALTSTCLEP